MKESLYSKILCFEIGKKLLEEVYGVEYDELTDENQDEIGYQRWADMKGWGFNDYY